MNTAEARAALELGELLPINLDIPTTVAAVIGALPRVKSFRETFVTVLPCFDIAAFDALESYADALAYAHIAFLAASEPTTDLRALLVRARAMRDRFVADADALAGRGKLDGRRLADLKGGTGYLAIAYDLGALICMIRERWTEISGKSAIQSSELDEAESLCEQVARAYGERTRQSVLAASHAEDRQRAYTVLLNTYDQARRAMQYIRWEEGDAEKIAPSLWSGRGGRGSKAKSGSNGGTNPPAPVDPHADPTQPVAPPPVEPDDPGMPGGSPFDNQ